MLPHPFSVTQPAVAVTATTEIIRDVLRVRANVSYTSSARDAGMRPYILPVLGPDDAEEMLEGMDGLLLTGGEDVHSSRYGARPHPRLGEANTERDAFEIALVLAARARRIPTLAICRGIQVLNVALGGTLIQDIPSEWPNAIEHDGASARDERMHALAVTEGSGLAEALGATSLMVNSFHHQSIARLADGLVVTARAPDGIIEGAEWSLDDWWVLAVQWHPEELTRSPEPYDRGLFRAFASATAAASASLRPR